MQTERVGEVHPKQARKQAAGRCNNCMLTFTSCERFQPWCSLVLQFCRVLLCIFSDLGVQVHIWLAAVSLAHVLHPNGPAACTSHVHYTYLQSLIAQFQMPV